MSPKSDLAQRWDLVYGERFMTMWYPNEDIVRFSARLIQKRLTYDTYDVKRRVGRVLDLGCGNGRHAVFFARQGLKAAGIDISARAVQWARDWCAREGLKVDLCVGDITQLPYTDGAFDVVVSHGVLDHILMAQARRVAEEVWRVMTPSGLFYCDLRSSEDWESALGREVAPHTRAIDEGLERGLIQHFFTLDEIHALLKDLFRPLYMERNDNAQAPDFRRRYSRWVLAAERLS